MRLLWFVVLLGSCSSPPAPRPPEPPAPVRAPVTPPVPAPTPPSSRPVPTTRPLSLDQTRRLAELRFVEDKLRRVYSYLHLKQQRHRFSFEEVLRQAEKKVLAATNQTQHLAALDEMLRTFRDGHLKLVRRGDAPRVKGPAVTHRWLPGRVLVTRIRRLFGTPRVIRRQLRQGIQLLKRARALVVDLRGNPGGSGALGNEYVAALITAPIVLGKSSARLSREILAARPHYKEIYPPDPARPGFARWREARVEPRNQSGFKGPIAGLIDQGCYSSCESLALALQQIPGARLFGQPTGGGSANPTTFALPHSRVRLMVPTWIFLKPDGSPIEDNGVLPALALPPGKDPLPAALHFLRESANR